MRRIGKHRAVRPQWCWARSNGHGDMADSLAGDRVYWTDIMAMSSISNAETRSGMAVAGDFIFILGMMPRTGTHFLTNLLCLHPDCVRSPLEEDDLLTGAHLLARYVNTLHRRWDAVMGEANPGNPELLYCCLGHGLLEFLRLTKLQGVDEYAGQAKVSTLAVPSPARPLRLVARNIRVTHLDYFFKLFPQAHLLLLIRDGRAVVESSVRTFGHEFESQIRAWARAADALHQFDCNPQHAGHRYLLVRYEDLYTQTEKAMRRILTFLNLEEHHYDFQAALHLPVVGSSTFKRGAGPVHWMPLVKTPEFDPLARTAHWSRAQHVRFNWLAAAQLERLGYAPKTSPGARWWWTLWNRGMDLKWLGRRVGGRLRHACISGWKLFYPHHQSE